MRRILTLFCAFAAAGSLVASATMAQAAAITIIKGEFGAIGTKRKLDITQSLQQYCGGEGGNCSVYCSETSFGRWSLGHMPVCRVIYRCPNGDTQSAEAAREELIMLRCQNVAGAERPLDELEPSRYQPPGR